MSQDEIVALVRAARERREAQEERERLAFIQAVRELAEAEGPGRAAFVETRRGRRQPMVRHRG